MGLLFSYVLSEREKALIDSVFVFFNVNIYLSLKKVIIDIGLKFPSKPIM